MNTNAPTGGQQPIADLCEQVARNQANRLSMAIAAVNYDSLGDDREMQSFMMLSQMLSQWLDRLMAWHEYTSRAAAVVPVEPEQIPVEALDA